MYSGVVSSGSSSVGCGGCASGASVCDVVGLLSSSSIDSVFIEIPPGINFWTSPFSPSVNVSVSPKASPRSTSTSYANRPPLRRMSSVNCVKMADNRVVCALSCERRSCVCEERSANETALLDFGLEASDSEGSVALRYSAASKRGSRKGASAGSDTCVDLGVVVFSSDTAMAIAGLLGDVAGVPECCRE